MRGCSVALMAMTLLCACAAVDPTFPLVFKPPLTSRERSVMQRHPDATPALQAMIAGTVTEASRRDGAVLTRMRIDAENRIKEEDAADQRAQEEKLKAEIEAVERRIAEDDRIERERAARDPQAPAPAPAEVHVDHVEPEPRPATARQEAVRDLKDARTCLFWAQQRMNYIREVEKATGRPAPSETTFKAGEQIVTCRTLIDLAQKRCREVKC